jgi:uncharacterized protein (DUF1330 family)
MNLCVLLWAREGRARELVAYEDRVLAILADHGGRVLQRARTSGAPGEPIEVHLLYVPSEEALASFTHDPRRLALTAERDAAIERTQVLQVDLVP